MNELMEYVELIKTIACRYYEKDMLFYENGRWYSRYHGEYLTLDEVCEFILDITKQLDEDDIDSSCGDCDGRDGDCACCPNY